MVDSKLSSPPLARWTILSVTTLSAFMVAIDGSIVTIALPKISAELASGVSLLGWVITAYILTSATLLLQTGKLGDTFGRKKIYLFGFAIFGVASALCGLSQNILELIGFRIMQGVGAAMLASSQVPILFEAFPPNQRGSAVGINSVAWAIGAASGPVLGGLLVSFDWRLIFYINVPIAAAAILIGSRKIPSSNHARGPENRSGITLGGINVVSSVFLALSVGALLIWLTFFDDRFALVGVAAFVILALNEIKSKNPLMNKELRVNRGFVYSTVSIGVLQIASLGITFVLSFYFQTVAKIAPELAGLYLAPFPVVQVVANPLAGRLCDKLRTPALLPITGAAIDGAGVAILSVLVAGGNASPLDIGLMLAIIGVGASLVWTPIISTTLRFVRPEIRGVANGTTFTLANIGFAASIAIIVAVTATVIPGPIVSQIFFGNLSNITLSQAALFSHGLSRALLTLAVVDAVAVPCLLLVLKEQRRLF